MFSDIDIYIYVSWFVWGLYVLFFNYCLINLRRFVINLRRFVINLLMFYRVVFYNKVNFF